MVGQIDELGRVEIPEEMRRVKGLRAGDMVRFFYAGGGIALRGHYGDERDEHCNSNDGHPDERGDKGVRDYPPGPVGLK